MGYFAKFGLTILIMMVAVIGMGQESCPTGVGYWVNQDERTLSGSSQPVPSAVTGLIASSVYVDRVNIRWQDNSNSEESIKIERRGLLDDYVEIGSVDANVTLYVDTTVLPSTTYYYRVRAYNENGYSMYTNEVSATTLPGEPPPPPIPPIPYDLSATSTISSQIDLTWKEDYTGLVDFPIQCRVGTDTNWSLIEELTIECDPEITIAFSDTNIITPVATYFYRVGACNETGQSDWSEEAWITLPIE